MSDPSWRNRYIFGRRTLASRLGLIEAPRRETVSHEMAAARELEQREMEYAARIEREQAEQVRQLRIDEAERRRVQADAEIAAVLAAMSPERRERARKRFGLPPELSDVKDEDE